MIFKEIILSINKKNLDDICGILYMNDVSGLVIEDEQDLRDFMENSGHVWDYIDEKLLNSYNENVGIKFYLSEKEYKELENNIKSSLKVYSSRNNIKEPELLINTVKDEDWENNWKKYYKPIEAGNMILINPVWEETPNTERIVYKSNPGMVFGTGTHQSTQLCIELMENYVKKGCDILDLGCGSGILSVISMLLGGGSAIAVDIDQKAEETVYENCLINGIDNSRCNVMIGNPLADPEILDKLKTKKYDMIFANIVADIIIEYLNIVPGLLKQGGTLIMSGIIKDREEDVRSKLKNTELSEDIILYKDDWLAISALKGD